VIRQRAPQCRLAATSKTDIKQMATIQRRSSEHKKKLIAIN